ncbi:ATPase family AAA domain-containing protein 5-like [Glandiceps talaboti]
MIGIMASSNEAANLLQSKKTLQKPLSNTTGQKTVPITNFFKPPTPKQEVKTQPKDLFGYFKKVEKSPTAEEKGSGVSSKQIQQSTSVPSQDGSKEEKKRKKTDGNTKKVVKKKAVKKTKVKSESSDEKANPIETTVDGEETKEQVHDDDHDLVENLDESQDALNVESNTTVILVTPVHQTSSKEVKKRKIEECVASPADSFEGSEPRTKKTKRKRTVIERETPPGKDDSETHPGKIDSETSTGKTGSQTTIESVTDEKCEGKDQRDCLDEVEGDDGVRTENGRNCVSEEDVGDSNDNNSLEVISYEQFLSSELEISLLNTTDNDENESENLEGQVEETSSTDEKSDHRVQTGTEEEELDSKDTLVSSVKSEHSIFTCTSKVTSTNKEDTKTCEKSIDESSNLSKVGNLSCQKTKKQRTARDKKVVPIPCGKTITTKALVHGPPSPVICDEKDTSVITLDENDRNSPSPEQTRSNGKHLRGKSNVVVDMNEQDLSIIEEGGTNVNKSDSQSKLKVHSFFMKRKPAQSNKEGEKKVTNQETEVKTSKIEVKGEKGNSGKDADKQSESENSNVSTPVRRKTRESKQTKTPKDSEGEEKRDGIHSNRSTTRQRKCRQVKKDALIAETPTPKRKTRQSEKVQSTTTEDEIECSETPKRKSRRSRKVSESDVTIIPVNTTSRKRKRCKSMTPRKKLALQKIFKHTKEQRKQSGKESDSDFEKTKTPQRRYSKRSSKRIYKSVMIDTGNEKNSPLRIRFTRLNKSLSDDSQDSGKKNQSTTNRTAKNKVAKAQQLLQRAKVKQHGKRGRGRPRKTASVKLLKKASTGSLRKIVEVVNLTISPEDEKSSKKPVKSINTVLGKKPIKSVSSGKQGTTPKGDINKAPVKLASIFTNFGKKPATDTVQDEVIEVKTVPSVTVIDDSSRDSLLDSDEALLARRNLLLSKMAGNAKKTSTVTSQPAPWPTISHVQQKETSGSGLWNLSLPSSKYLIGEERKTSTTVWNCANMELGCLTLALEKCNVSLAVKKGLTRRELSYSIRKRLLQEIIQYNANYPVNRWFKRYLVKKKGNSVCGTQPKGQDKETEKKTDEQNKNNIGRGGKRKSNALDKGNETNRRKMARRNSKGADTGEDGSVRRSSRRLQSKVITEESKDVIEEKKENDDEKKKDVKKMDEGQDEIDKSKDVLWTDKYQPSQMSEIIGNKESVKKLHSWLSEWKMRSEREKKKLKKQMKKEAKKSKEKSVDSPSNEWWYDDDDSDFDVSDESDSDYDDEDTICNSVLIKGPCGVGKTASVYACAQELGFKVFEVNASSKRNGKQILSDLKEATQSHQVSRVQGAAMFAKLQSPAVKPGPALPIRETIKKTPVHSAFASFLKKPDSGPDKKGKTQKKGVQKDETTKVEKTNKGTKNPKVSAETSNILKMKIASTSLILFEEVDIIFEEDKGFWAAINTLMSTTKRPIIMTTSDPRFVVPTEGLYEEIILKVPPIITIVTNLQVMCLAEDIRTNSHDIERLVDLHHSDIRRCIHCLQFWAESGASGKSANYEQIQGVRTITDSKIRLQGKDSKEDNVGDCTSDVKNKCSPLKDGGDDIEKRDNLCIGNEIEDFELEFFNNLIDLEIKTIAIGEFYQSNGIEEREEMKKKQIQDMSLQGAAGVAMETDNVKLPDVDDLCMESCVGLLNQGWRKGGLLQHLQDEDTSLSTKAGMFAAMADHGKNVIRSNMDCLNSASTGRHDCKNDTELEESPIKESQVVNHSLESWSEYLDNVSCADLIDRTRRDDYGNQCCHDNHAWWTAKQTSGLGDQLTKLEDIDWSVQMTTKDVSSCLSVVSLNKFKSQQRRLRQQIRHCQEQNSLSDKSLKDISQDNIYELLNIPRNNDGNILTLDLESQNQLSYGRKCQETNDSTSSVLPLHTRCNHGVVAMDYLPAVRTICRAEKYREVTNAKRRFLHYLDQIAMTLQPSVQETLTEAFVVRTSTTEGR